MKRRATRTPELEAGKAVALAIKEGRLAPATQKPCITCKRPADRHHHWDYAPEHRLDVVPMCRQCHAAVHAGRIPDPTSGATWVRAPKPRAVTPDVLERRAMYGDRLRDRRKLRGLSQTDAGELVGLSGGGWQNIEAGWHCVNEFTLHRMATALGLRLTLALSP